MVFELRMSLDEAKKLFRRVRGTGGFQSLIRQMQNQCFVTFIMNEQQLERFHRYRREYGRGGFQSRMGRKG